jgi:hypothetical protein
MASHLLILMAQLKSARSRIGSLQMNGCAVKKNRQKQRKTKNMLNTKINRVSLGYKQQPPTAVVATLGWIIKCMTGNLSFPKPPVPLVPPVPPDPDAPVDMTTRLTGLQAAISNAVDSGTAETAAKTAALEFVFEGMDANAFYVNTIARTNLPLMLASGYSAVSTNRGQSPLDAPSITGIDNDISTQLVVHLTSITNAIGYEVQTLVGTVWTTVMFSRQARTITLTGQPTGQVVQVRARALGGSTGQSGWSAPSSSIVD